MKKHNLIIVIILIAFLTVGCGIGELNDGINLIKETVSSFNTSESNTDKQKTNSKLSEKKQHIVSMVEQVVECLDAKDADGIANLYYDEITEDTRKEIDRFIGYYSQSETVLADCGTFLREGKNIDGISYERYSGVSAIIITDDNAYGMNIVFLYNKKDKNYSIIQMRFSTGKSEAYENLDYSNRDYLKYEEQFLYVDYHDEDFDNLSEYSGYEVIFGNIVASRGESAELTLEEAENLMDENVTEEMVIEKLGEPRASINWGTTYSYYTLPGDSDNYIMLNFDDRDNGKLIYCKVVSNKYTGWVDVE